MRSNRMKSPEYVSEFIETQVSVGALVEVYYIKDQGKALVYTNLTFRIATKISLEQLENMLLPYEKRKVNRKAIVKFNLKEVK